MIVVPHGNCPKEGSGFFDTWFRCFLAVSALAGRAFSMNWRGLEGPVVSVGGGELFYGRGFRGGGGRGLDGHGSFDGGVGAAARSGFVGFFSEELLEGALLVFTDHEDLHVVDEEGEVGAVVGPLGASVLGEVVVRVGLCVVVGGEFVDGDGEFPGLVDVAAFAPDMESVAEFVRAKDPHLMEGVNGGGVVFVLGVGGDGGVDFLGELEEDEESECEPEDGEDDEGGLADWSAFRSADSR